MHSVLLDTSFCIRLLKKDDEFHENAKDYFEYFLRQKIAIYISTITIAEYSVRDDPNNLPLKTMRIIPFDFFDGQTAGECHSILLEHRESVKGHDRDAIKDDCKLIAQICNRKIEGYITKDQKSYESIIKPIVDRKRHSLVFIDLSIPLKNFTGTLF